MVKIIVGLMGGSVASGSSKLASTEQLRALLSVVRSHGVHELDTARVYDNGKSEEGLGLLPEGRERFAIATKVPGFSPGSLAYNQIVQACEASLAALKQDKIDLYYFHGPDRQTPLEESCRAINDLHQAHKFSRFGISNFRAEEVEEIHSVCMKNGWIKPTVYQGGYNALGRLSEEKLFPTLRRLGIQFYAFSPLAGGYFSRPASELRQPPAGGRMDSMKVFYSMYVNDVSLRLHDELAKTCEDEGLTMKEATLRWLLHHSILQKDDGVVLGGSSVEQMEENLTACERGPLPASVATAFDELYGKSCAGGMNLPYSP